MMFFEGYLPQKIISHRLLGKSSQTGVMVEFRLRWRKRANENKRHKATSYSNAQLKLVAPTLLADYYKELFVRDLVSKKMANNEKQLEAVVPVVKEVEKDKKLDKVNNIGKIKKYGLIAELQPSIDQIVKDTQPSILEKLNPQVSSSSVEEVKGGSKSIFDGKLAYTTKEKVVQKIKKVKKDKNRSNQANKKDSIDLTKYFSALPQAKTNYFAVSTSSLRNKPKAIIEDEEIYCED